MSNMKQTKRVTPVSSDVLFTMLETLPGAFFILDDAATIVYANASAQILTGATPEKLCGKLLWSSAPQLVSTALYQAVQKVKQTREPGEVEYGSPVTQTCLHVQLSPTVDGLMMQVHQGRAASTAAQRQETVSQGKRLSLDDLGGVFSRIGVLTHEGIVLEINEDPFVHTQIRREEVIGQPLAETQQWSFYPTSQAQLHTAIARASRGETTRFETVVHPREGMDRHLDVTIIPHRDVEHHIEYLVFVGIDITKRKRAEAEIHALIDAIPQLVWTGRPDGYVDFYNQRWRDYTGLSTEEAQGAGWMQCTHPDDRQRVLEVWQNAVQTGTPYETEQRLRQSTTGNYRWFLMQATPYKDAQGTILKYIGTCTDIEEQKRAEERMKESEQNWRVLAETVPQLVWTTRADGLSDYFNQRFCDYTHATWDQLYGYGWSQFVHPEDYERTLAVRAHAFRTGTPYEVAYRFREGQTGRYRWFLARAMPIRDEAGQIVRWFGTCTDIHEKKQAAEELRVLIDAIPQLVWILRPDSFSEYGNQRWCDYTGMTREQYQGDGWRQALHPDDYQHTLTLWHHARVSGEPFEIEYRLKEGKTGEYRWFLARALPVHDEAGQIIKWFGTCTDIEEQKRIEEALRQSQKRIRALIDSNIIGIVSVEGEEEVLVEANEAFLHMTGYTQEDVHSRTLNRVKITPPEHEPFFQHAIQEVNTCGKHTPLETEIICKDGSHLSVLVGSVTFQERPRQNISFVLDNSARKELEQRKDDFISMASHELRNPLTALKLQTTLLHRQLARQGTLDQAPALASMETQIKTITRLVEELLDVSKIQAGRLEYVQETVDLDALLREVADTIQQTHPSHRILVRGAVQTSMLADRDRLGQVVTNLLSNAIKYSPGAETVEIDLSTSEEEVTIRVQDHGLGIPQEQRDKIFERFYRVAASKQKAIPGLGMGLYIVAEIVKGHGGSITVDSEAGNGSTFTVTLPTRGMPERGKDALHVI